MTQLLAVSGLNKTYADDGRTVHALRDVSLHISVGECLGVVGESGSGKSTLVRLLLALERPDSGEAMLDGVPMFQLKPKELRAMRRHIQVVFQDPSAALNQRLPIWRSIMEPLDNFPDEKPAFLADVRHSRRETAVRLLEMVGLQAAHLDRYPHELSGGQKQRVAIARGISLGPKLLICDEPTSSLDVSVQAQMLKLLKELKRELGIAYLFISHDIAAVSMMSDRFIVMKEGQIVDRFARGQLLGEERHAYTRELVAAAT
ncbi:ABC transporter ATP-binding protein [Paenibacillus prosopidis]|uniref:ABC transporter family protein n=1 Tax=Paenibacillus prosopidis TaxID=630520 RepID=A0A368VJG2_9BACL|nr:dipeptide/oligopeptide/nickel ABC transporter ATP-binding protein [Paenibacillus prosopidis]RCW41742.1 ABC transporter family protein [Paenibacillus prosopidis]